jgi:hypothetical protein
MFLSQMTTVILRLLYTTVTRSLILRMAAQK